MLRNAPRGRRPIEAIQFMSKRLERRVGVEPTTCGLRIGCSTTELPRPALTTIAFAENYCQFIAQNGVLSVRGRIHRPSDSHADQKKQKQRPHDVFHPVDRPPPAQETKRDGNQPPEEQHRLQMTELHSHFCIHALRLRAASYACSAASRFSTPAPAVARKRVP